MIPALEYFLKRLYEVSECDADAYAAHLAAVEQAFDLHHDYLTQCRERASQVIFNEGPFCWKHVDVQHGIVMEDVLDATPIATHKPVLILPRIEKTEPTMCFYALAFYMTMVQWSVETVETLTTLYSSFLLKQTEDCQYYSLAASMSITWADSLQGVAYTEKQWEKRFWAFGILITKNIQCPHACGNMIIMGPDYFEQISDEIEPNVHIHAHNWSIPFGIIDTDSKSCTFHLQNAVTYAQTDIEAGSFIRMSFLNPLVVKNHPCHVDQKGDEMDNMCRNLLLLATAKLEPDAIPSKILDIVGIIRQHIKMIPTIKVSKLWPTPFSSVPLTMLTAMACVLQQADDSMPEMKAGVDVLCEVLPLLNLPYKGWYFSMFMDLQQPVYQHEAFDALRSAVRQTLLKSWGHADIFARRIIDLKYN